jgi:hypothetical protein
VVLSGRLAVLGAHYNPVGRVLETSPPPVSSTVSHHMPISAVPLYNAETLHYMVLPVPSATVSSVDPLCWVLPRRLKSVVDYFASFRWLEPRLRCLRPPSPNGCGAVSSLLFGSLSLPPGSRPASGFSWLCATSGPLLPALWPLTSLISMSSV